jgi:serine/threonine-protein kinase
LNRDQENASLTDGVQDQILTDLTRISELKVISRTSVMAYQSETPRNLRQIGQQLRVAYLVEGSVQRAGGKVRVNAQLIDAHSNARLWAKSYDRDLADVFAIQSEIAKAIASQLRAKLSPAEKAEIERAPTSDLEAFDLYTRGKKLVDLAGAGDDPEPNFRAGVDLLNQAVERDPTFYAAYCHLARAHGSFVTYGFDNSPARRALGQAAVDAARRLAPDFGDAHLAAAMHFYSGLEYERAREELTLVGRSLPNDPRTFELSAYIHRRQGRWEESTRDLERAIEFDPLNADALQQLVSNYEAIHAYPAWVATVERIIPLQPERIGLRVMRAKVDIAERADTRRLHEELEALKRDPANANALVEFQIELALNERDFVALANALAKLGERRFGTDWGHFSRAFGEGLLARMTGDTAAARAAFAADRITQERIVQRQPEHAPAVSVLGLIDAGLGRKEEALREGRRAVELLPTAKDSIRGPYMVSQLAIIAAWVGEKDLAIEQLHLHMKELHAGPHYGQLKLDPMWDPLRGDARFEEIVASLAPKDVR